MTSLDVTLDEVLPAEVLAALAAAAEGRELSVVEKLFLHGVRVVKPEAAKRHMRREWWKVELKLLVWPVLLAAIAGVCFLDMQLGPFGHSENAQILESQLGYFGFIAAGIFALISTLNAVVSRPQWVSGRVFTIYDLPPVARGIPDKVRAALGDDAQLFEDRLIRMRVLDPGLRVVIGEEEHYLLFYDMIGLPVDLPTVDPFDRAA